MKGKSAPQQKRVEDISSGVPSLGQPDKVADVVHRCPVSHRTYAVEDRPQRQVIGWRPVQQNQARIGVWAEVDATGIGVIHDEVQHLAQIVYKGIAQPGYVPALPRFGAWIALSGNYGRRVGFAADDGPLIVRGDISAEHADPLDFVAEAVEGMQPATGLENPNARPEFWHELHGAQRHRQRPGAPSQCPLESYQ